MVPMKSTASTKTTKATHLNIFTLAGCASENGVKADGTFANRIESTSRNGMRRCLAAGLVEIVDRSTLRLTPAGIAAVLGEMRDQLIHAARPSTNGWTPTAKRAREIENMKVAFSNLGGSL